MSLDLQSYHPEEPRIPSVISVREGVLLSLIAHLIGLLVYVLSPRSTAVEPLVPPPASPVEFVQLTPKADLSKLQNMTRDRARQPENAAPKVDGTTPEKVLGAPDEKPKGDPAPDPPVATPTAPTTPLPPVESTPPPQPKPGGILGDSLRNIQKFLHTESYDNPQGGAQNAYSPDIQFDDKGIDFGPWLARFKAQIERNWSPPQAFNKGHVVFQFYVLKNGTIIEIHMLQPSGIGGYDASAQTALRLSNPTTKLPEEYPADRVLFTVTFHYNER